MVPEYNYSIYGATGNQQRVQDSTYEVLQGEDERADEMDPEDNQADTHGLPGRRVFTPNRLIQKAREGVRHAQGKSPLRILKYSKANDEVMKAARNKLSSTTSTSSRTPSRNQHQRSCRSGRCLAPHARREDKTSLKPD